jgi:SulP family sulfate permease
LLAPLLSWVPVAALAGLLLVIGFRMIDWHLFHLARSRATILDFIVIVSVVVVAKTVSLIAASALGVVLAIMMFIREQSHSPTIRHKSRGDLTFSKRVRPGKEREALRELGVSNLIYELQGSLFFGNTDALFSTLEPELKQARYLILDFQRVQSLDMTAAHMLDRVRDQLAERGASLVLSRVPATLPSGRNLRGYLSELGVTGGKGEIRMFDDFIEALEWVEQETLKAAGIHAEQENPLNLSEFEFFRDMQPKTLQALQSQVYRRYYEAGETIFIAGTPGDALMLIAHGVVRIDLDMEDGRQMHMATFGRGQFFGEMSFLDHHPHSADVTAVTDAELLILSRPDFDRFAEQDPLMASHLFASLSRALADRLRHTNDELRSMQAA